MNAAAFLADAGNIGLTACAALDTAGVIAYWIRAHGGDGGKWWSTPFGVHLMCFMAAFAIVLDQSVIYLLTGPGLIVTSTAGIHPDWFAWERTASFAVLIPAVLAWRLWLILRPPKRLRLPLLAVVRVVRPDGGEQLLQQDAALIGRLLSHSALIPLLIFGTVQPWRDLGQDRPLRRDLAQHARRAMAGGVEVRGQRPHAAAHLVGPLGRRLVLVQPRRDERGQVIHASHRLTIPENREPLVPPWSEGLPHNRIQGNPGRTR